MNQQIQNFNKLQNFDYFIKSWHTVHTKFLSEKKAKKAISNLHNKYFKHTFATLLKKSMTR